MLTRRAIVLSYDLDKLYHRLMHGEEIYAQQDMGVSRDGTPRNLPHRVMVPVRISRGCEETLNFAAKEPEPLDPHTSVLGQVQTIVRFLSQGFGEMTVEDVKFSFERQIKRTKGMLFAQNLDVIKEITVVDPYTTRTTIQKC
jgi:hypothetical protein